MFSQMQDSVTLWGLLFTGEKVTHVFVIVIMMMAAVMLYYFFLKYFSLNDLARESPNFLDNIIDYIHDKRIEAARDLCKRTRTMESRIIFSGLNYIEASHFEIHYAVCRQSDLEQISLYRKVNRFAWFPIAILLMGFLGSSVSLMDFLISQSDFSLQPKHFYSFLLPLVLGNVVAMIGFFIKTLLMSKINKIQYRLRNKSYNLLEIINQYIKP